MSELKFLRFMAAVQILTMHAFKPRRDGASQRVNVTCVTPLGDEVASTL